MVGDADLQIYQEQNSVWWTDSRRWSRDLGHRGAAGGATSWPPKYEIDDDHVMLHSIGDIPLRRDRLRLSPLAYPRRHAGQMLPAGLAKVGWVIREWLRTAP